MNGRLKVAASRCISCVAVALDNLTERRLRLAAALSGVAVALFLLLLQVAILDAMRAKITQLFDDMNFDLAIVPDTYQFLLTFETFNRVALNEASSTGDVAGTYGLNVDVVHWIQQPSKRDSYMFLVGLDDPGEFVRDPVIRAGFGNLTGPHSILIDDDSQAEMGSLETGTTGQIRGENLAVSGHFNLGLFFYAPGGAIVRNTEFPRLAGRDPRVISIGLLRLVPGVRPEDAKARLIERLPANLLVLTQDELLEQERAYFLSTKPIGLLIYISMLIACVVSTVIMIQVLSTEISTRMKEYAVLKAMGFSTSFVYGIGMAQASILGLGGLLPATLAGAGALWIVHDRTHLSSQLTPALTGTMVAITVGLSMIAALLVIHRIRHADPAELF
jgi:putative ABC transport system permease protein